MRSGKMWKSFKKGGRFCLSGCWSFNWNGCINDFSPETKREAKPGLGRERRGVGGRSSATHWARQWKERRRGSDIDADELLSRKSRRLRRACETVTRASRHAACFPAWPRGEWQADTVVAGSKRLYFRGGGLFSVKTWNCDNPWTAQP